MAARPILSEGRRHVHCCARQHLDVHKCPQRPLDGIAQSNRGQDSLRGCDHWHNSCVSPAGSLHRGEHMGAMVDEDQRGEKGRSSGRLLCAPSSGTSRRKGAVTLYSWHELAPVLVDGKLEPSPNGEDRKVRGLLLERSPRNPVAVVNSIRREKPKTIGPRRLGLRKDGSKEEQHE
jgi:hypothetical protein